MTNISIYELMDLVTEVRRLSAFPRHARVQIALMLWAKHYPSQNHSRLATAGELLLDLIEAATINHSPNSLVRTN